MKNTQESNKLIAEFMGMRVEKIKNNSYRGWGDILEKISQ